MNTFNKKSLCVALAATGMLGAAGVAQAVNVSENGLGNVLIYPYYTVNKDINGNSYNTLMSVVNTTASTKAVKVRFREGKNSVEVLDFNVFLSPFDVWTASITPTGRAGGGQIATTDKSCTIPTFPAGGVDFRTLEFEATDNAVDAHVGRLLRSLRNGDVRSTPASIGRQLQARRTACRRTARSSPTRRPTHGSKAAARRPVRRRDHSEPGGRRRVLAKRHGTGQFLDDQRNYQTPARPSRTTANADPPISNVIIGAIAVSNGLAGASGPSPGDNAVTAVLMANAVTNEYVLDAGSKSQTTLDRDVPDEVRLRQRHGGSVRSVHAEVRHRRSARARPSSASCSTAKKVRRRSSRRRLLAAAWSGRRTCALLGSAEHRLRQRATCSGRRTTTRSPRRSATAGRCSASTVARSERALAPRCASGTTDDLSISWAGGPADGSDRDVLRPAGGWLRGRNVPERRHHRQRQDVPVDVRCNVPAPLGKSDRRHLRHPDPASQQRQQETAVVGIREGAGRKSRPFLPIASLHGEEWILRLGHLVRPE